MTLHIGHPYLTDSVSLQPPIPANILKISPADDLLDVVQPALHWAQTANHVYYFSAYEQQRLVGAIYLHDIDLQSGDALIGYHLFYEQDRGRGIGAKMLGLLQAYVVHETQLKRLIIITEYTNNGSRGIARKCGFNEIGGAWEDPDKLVVYAWTVTRT